MGTEAELFTQPPLSNFLGPLLLHDRESGLHSTRVGLLLPKLLRRLRYEGFLVGALVGAGHDIGKIGNDVSVLRKAGALTDEEREHMKRHVRYGIDILKDERIFTDELLYIIGQHHEWRERNPYPRQRRRSEHVLDEYGQALAISDMYDRVGVGSVFRKRATGDLRDRLMDGFSGEERFVDAVLEIHRGFRGGLPDFLTRVAERYAARIGQHDYSERLAVLQARIRPAGSVSSGAPASGRP